MRYKIRNLELLHEGVVPNFKDEPRVSWTADTEAGEFEFDAWFYGGQWNVYVVLPDTTARKTGVYKGVPTWASQIDYVIEWNETVTEINRLAGVKYKIWR